MPVSVIFGGQFGSEGKGKTAFFFARQLNAKAVIRVGGPNSGHTILDPNGSPVVLKQLPVSSFIPGVFSVITSGNYINLDILLEEIKLSGILPESLLIDPYAALIESVDLEAERTNNLMAAIGSTGSGIGSAVSRRVNRHSDFRFAKDEPVLKNYVSPTTPFLRNILDTGGRVLIEGTQGFGLSLLHSGMFPYTTSRDTSAAAFVSEAGLSPLDVDEVIMVIRSYPIRVGGNSGPLLSEIDWDSLTKLAGSDESLIEYTSVTKKVRRVGHFHPEIVRKAIEVNNPNRIVLNHVDYIDSSCRHSNLSEKAYERISEIERLINRQIDFLGFDRAELYPTLRNVGQYQSNVREANVLNVR